MVIQYAHYIGSLNGKIWFLFSSGNTSLPCTLTGITINIAMKYDDIIYEHPLINMVLLCHYLPIKSIIHRLICKIEDYSAEIKKNDC